MERACGCWIQAVGSLQGPVGVMHPEACSSQAITPGAANLCAIATVFCKLPALRGKGGVRTSRTRQGGWADRGWASPCT